MSDVNPKLEELFDEAMNQSDLNLLRESIGSGELNNQIQLQNKIEKTIRKSFECESVDVQTLRKKLIALGAADVSASRHWNRSGLLALAASLLLAITIGYSWLYQPSTSIQFNQVSLVKLYDETVGRGFRPYYDCSEPQRFAAEFKRRQGVELRLDTLAPGQAMLGVSYLGGISRNTTAVLFEDDESPVVVFVDKVDLDPSDVLTQNQTNSAAQIHKTTRYGLVFYEVSKSSKPQMTQYFQLVD